MDNVSLDYASQKLTEHQVRPLSRLLAIVLDLVLLGPIVALILLAGSFNSQSSHNLLAAYWPIWVMSFLYLATEAMFGVTPGLLIIGARVMPAEPKRRLYRWVLKYGGVILSFVIRVTGRDLGLSGIVVDSIVIAVFSFSIAVLATSFVTLVRTRGCQEPYFDSLAKAQLLYVRQ